MSANHFIRALANKPTSQQAGITPHRYVLLCRLERDIVPLKEPDTSVAEVADGVGFAIPSPIVARFVTQWALRLTSSGRGPGLATRSVHGTPGRCEEQREDQGRA